MFATIEAAVFGGAFMLAGDVSHFTWWGIGVFVADRACESVGAPIVLQSRVNMLVLTTAILIQATVVGMSLWGCGLLKDTHVEMGSWPYALGNFALHYYPGARCLCRYLHLPTMGVTLNGALFICTYVLLNAPAKVYDCTLEPVVAAPLGVIAATAIELTLLHFNPSAAEDGLKSMSSYKLMQA